MGHLTMNAPESNLEFKKTKIFERFEEEFSAYFKKIEEFGYTIDRRDDLVFEKEGQIGNLYNEVMDRYEGIIILDEVENKDPDVTIGDEVNKLHTAAFETTFKWRKRRKIAIFKGWVEVYKTYFEYNIFPPTDSFQEIIDELESMEKLNKIFEEINSQYDTYFEHLNNLKELLLKNLELADDFVEL